MRSGKERKMSAIQSKVTMEELITRLAELEGMHAHLVEELADLRAEQPVVTKQLEVHTWETLSERSEKPRWQEQETTDKRKSRRNILRRALWTAATVIGAGAVLQRSSGIAQAN